jgi:hypothetical protein
LTVIDASARPETLGGSSFRWWRGEHVTIGWKGHLYLPGRPAGSASVSALGAALETGDLAVHAPKLHGIYALLVHDSRRGGWQVAVDNGGMYKVFHDETKLATSFLGLLRARGATVSAALPERLVEYIAHGAVYGRGTVVAGIEKLRGDEVLELSPASGKRIRTKAPMTSMGSATDVVVRHFADLAPSLAGRRLSVDITGGFDTRLIACLLDQHHLEFELAISGRSEAEDVQIARRIATILKRPFWVTPHDVSRLDEELATLFRAGDGLIDLRRFHRDWQNASARLGRGVEVMSHGGGGAHFKDFFCYQDFPFYGSTNVNFERYYDLRIAPVGVPLSYFTHAAAELAEQVRTRTLESFAGYRALTNNESYDRVAYYLRAPEFYGQCFSNYINMGLDVVAPFLDYACAHAGMGSSPWARFFNGWHRRLTTRYCGELAALPTTEGYNASSSLRDLVPNFVGFAGTQLRRGAKKASQRVLGRALFLDMGAATVDVEGFPDLLRGTGTFARALDRLKARGILAPELVPEQVRDIHVGRVLTAGMLLDYLES